MLIFDLLPSEVRRALAESIEDWAVTPIFEAVQERSRAEVLDRIRTSNAIALKMYAEEVRSLARGEGL